MGKMKKRLLRPVCAVLLCLTLSIGSAYTSYAAMPGVFLGAEEALAAVLMMLGISAASDNAYSSADALAEWGGEQVDGLVQHISTSQKYAETLGKLGADALKAKVTEWATKAGRGVIDTASDVWGALKDWAGSLHKTVSVGVSSPSSWGYGSLVPASPGTMGYTRKSLYVDEKSYFYSDSPAYLLIANTALFMYSPVAGSVMYKQYLSDSNDPVITAFSLDNSCVVDGQTVYFWGSIPDKFLRWTSDYSQTLVGVSNTGLGLSSRDTAETFFSRVLRGESYEFPADAGLKSVGGVGDIYERDGSLDNVGLTGVGVGTKAGDVPIDWAGFGDVAGTLEGIRTGVLDIADVMAGSKVWAYDTTRDTVIDSDKDLDNDIPIADVIPGANVSDYTITGLQDVFPFCIPFDLIDFLNVLDAEPEAPRFQWDFEYAKGKVYKFDLDLSRFETVAAAFRTFELLGFCLALILITRDKMIKG